MQSFVQLIQDSRKETKTVTEADAVHMYVLRRVATSCHLRDLFVRCLPRDPETMSRNEPDVFVGRPGMLGGRWAAS